MSSFRDYLSESEFWAERPRQDDEFDLELAPDEIIESRVLESDGETIVLEATEEIIGLMEQRGMFAERIARYGPVGSNRGQGFTVSEEAEEIEEEQVEEDPSFRRMMELAGVADHKFDKEDDVYREDQDAAVVAQKELADRISNPMPGVHEGVGEKRDTVEFDIPTFIRMLEYAREDAKDDMDLHDVAEKAIELSQDGSVLTMDDYNAIVGDAEEEIKPMDEAEYQGRKVPLGKPMRGDVKKFKVYVKDPKTGNVKKVNFGHGGTSAKRAGQKTMKIKKSNPARRKSFRARHRCSTAKDRTTARYWSCRAW